jgi:dihydrofolate synthase/folylpolyglutamate synthase
MEVLGNPEQRLKIVHVAGTSGKTSTAYYSAALLAATGSKIGLAVSPHLDKLTERIQINGQPISEQLFCAELGEFLEIVQRAKQQPTYFELLYAFTLWVFDRQQVDYVVVETGMGGLHDATNVAERPDKICIITDIGLDHTHILGTTLPAIAAQKIGIAHPGNQVFVYQQAPEIMKVFKDWTTNHSAELHITTEDQEAVQFGDELDGLPMFQRRNWLLAYFAFKYLAERDNLPNLTEQALLKTWGLQVPGRMDIRHIGGKTIVMDGAHNAQKMQAFIDSFRRLYPDVRPTIMLAFKNDKDYQPMVSKLSDLSDHIIITTFNVTQDLPVRSTKPKSLVGAFKRAGVAKVEAIDDQREAFQKLLAVPGDVVVITGSFYLLSQIRNNEGIA